MKFYRCSVCGNIIAYVEHVGGDVMCCGRKMEEMIPNTVEASVEKHKPVIEQTGNKVVVTVGSVLHPMEEKHYIKWVALETKKGNQRKMMKPGQEPKVIFMLEDGDEVVNAFAYCNLHGLWGK